VKAPIKWEAVDVTPQLKDGKTSIKAETIESIKRNKVALKGPLAVSTTTSLTVPGLIVFRRQLVKDMSL
jgi:isocitrate dehydrogenase